VYELWIDKRLQLSSSGSNNPSPRHHHSPPQGGPLFARVCLSDLGDDGVPRKARFLAFWGGMTRDVGDPGDRRASRAHPSPGVIQIGVGFTHMGTN
jgi:hypothetical protein